MLRQPAKLFRALAIFLAWQCTTRWAGIALFTAASKTFETPFRLTLPQQWHAYFWEEYGFRWADCLCQEYKNHRESAEKASGRWAADTRERMWEMLLRDPTKHQTCHKQATEIVEETAYKSGRKERLSDRLALREMVVMQFHTQYRYHLTLCTCHLDEVLEKISPPVDDEEHYFARLSRERECEVEALRRLPDDAVQEWRPAFFTEPASARLLGLLDELRTFSSHAARGPPRLDVVGGNALGIARSAGSAGFRAGANQLSRARETAAQLPRRLLKSVFNIGVASGGRAGGLQTRRPGGGIKPFPPFIGPRGR